MAEVIDGKERAAHVRAGVADRVAKRSAAGKRAPGLATVLVGDDPASHVYVGRKHKATEEVGMVSAGVALPGDVPMARLLETIGEFNSRDDIDGILVQLPLPKGLDSDAAILAIDPAKDVDGLHPVSQGALFTGGAGMRPCTPSGCMDLIASTGCDLSGKHAVVVGRSALVGKPIAMMLLEQNATVVMCHSRTRDLPEQVGAADVVIAACGVPELVKGAWIKEGAVVIDVGINRVEGKLIGDVEYAAASERAGFITPVPGGVGPMTVAMLLRNTIDACEAREKAAA